MLNFSVLMEMILKFWKHQNILITMLALETIVVNHSQLVAIRRKIAG